MEHVQVPEEVMDSLRKHSTILGEVREQIKANEEKFATKSDLAENEKRIVDAVVADITAKQSAELTALKENEIRAQWAKLDEVDQKLNRAIGLKPVDTEERDEQWHDAFREFLATGGDTNGTLYRSFLQEQRENWKPLDEATLRSLPKAERRRYEQRTLTINNMVDGGFLAPPAVQLELQKLFTRIDPVGALAFKPGLAPGQDSYKIPRITTNVETAAAAAVVSETGTPTAAQPNFGLQQRFLHPVATLSPSISYDWLRSISNGESILAEWAGETIGYLRNQQYLTGTDVQCPQGLIGANTTSGTHITTDVDAADTSGHLVTAPDFISLLVALKAPYRANGVFLFNTTTLGKIMKLRDNSGGAGTGQFLLPVSARDGFPNTIFGRPFYTAENVQDDGTNDNYAVVFGDFAKYCVAEDEGVVVFRDTMSVMPNQRILWRLKHDGCIMNAEGFVRLKM